MMSVSGKGEWYILGHIAVLRRYDLLLQRGLLVGLSVCHDRDPAKMADTNEMPFGMWTPVGPRNLIADEGPDPHMQRAILRGWLVEDFLVVNILKAIQQGAAPYRCKCRLRCTRQGARWRHLANTTEPSTCSGDAALHQITATACSSRYLGQRSFSSKLIFRTHRHTDIRPTALPVIMNLMHLWILTHWRNQGKKARGLHIALLISKMAI